MAEDTDRTDPRQTTDQPYGDVLASWEFDEHERFKRTRVWYLASVLAVVALLFYSYIDNNPLFAIIVILSAIVFIIGEYRGPSRMLFQITEDGLVVGNSLYRYADIHDFFILYTPPDVKVLYFDPKNVARPLLGVPLENQNPSEIRKILLPFLKEDLEREAEPTSDYLGRLFKF